MEQIAITDPLRILTVPRISKINEFILLSFKFENTHASEKNMDVT